MNKALFGFGRTSLREILIVMATAPAAVAILLWVILCAGLDVIFDRKHRVYPTD